MIGIVGLVVAVLVVGVGSVVWVAAMIIGQYRRKEVLGRRYLLVLFLALGVLDLILTVLYQIKRSGLHFSGPREQLSLELVLSFMLFVVGPLAPLIIHRYRQSLTPAGACLTDPNRVHLRRVCVATALVWVSVVLFLVGRAGGWPPLLFAARNDYRALEEFLIGVGVDVNARDRYYGKTALDYAVWRGDSDMIKRLVDRGAEVNERSTDHWTPLMAAVAAGRIEVAELLLERGAEVNAISGYGETALMQAFSRGNVAMIDLLTEKGAAFHPRFKDGYEVMMNVLRGGDRQELERLLANERLRNTSSPLRLATGLANAASDGDSERVRYWLEIGADANCRGLVGRTPLMGAANPEVAALLLAHGARIEDQDENGWTALALAAQAGRLEVVRSLLRSGADIQTRDKGGRTVLMHAAWGGHPEIAEALIDEGIDVDARDNHGETALMGALRQSRVDVDVVRLLLARGTDVDLATADGQTALELARQRGDEQILELVTAASHLPTLSAEPGPQSNRQQTRVLLMGQMEPGSEREVFLAINTGDVQKAEKLLREGYRINAKVAAINGGTALGWAAYCNQPQMVELLLRSGADVDAKSNDDVTALMEAVRTGSLDIAELLIAANANIQAQTRKGWSALMWACEQGRLALVGRLLRGGADVNLRNQRGDTALSLARRGGHSEIVALLEKHGARE